MQSANATNSASDRAALDLEVQQRLAEVERISSQTSFNGQKILDGTFGNAAFQVGANVGETITVALSTSTRTNAIGQIAFFDGASSNADVPDGSYAGGDTVTVGNAPAVTLGASVAGTANRQGADSAFAKAQVFSSVNGLTVEAQNNIEFTVAATGGSAGDTYSLRLNGVDIFAAADTSAAALTAQQITDAINTQTATTGVTATLTGSDLRLSSVDGRTIAIGQDLGGGAVGGITAGGGGATTVNGVTFIDGVIGTTAQVVAGSDTTGTDNVAAENRGTLVFSATENVVFSANGTAFGLAGNTITRDTTTLSSVTVSTVSGANDAIRRVDSALTSVSNLRSTFGAIQNRFESTINNLQTTSENLAASRSRILDADFAAETAELTRTQILQQAGTAILAQANQIPQNVLSLLR